LSYRGIYFLIIFYFNLEIIKIPFFATFFV